MKNIFLLCCCLLSLVIAFALQAHEKHGEKPKEEKKTETTSPQGQQAVEIKEVEKEEPLPVPLPFSGPILDHAHNKLVHFPLAFGVAGALLVFLSLKKPEMLSAVRVLWLLAALFSVGAYFTGEAQEEPFEEGAKSEIVKIHENLGIATAISLGIGFLLSLSRRLKGLTVIWAILVLAFVSVTGYYGGLLAHS